MTDETDEPNAELRRKLQLAETVQRFYNELPAYKRAVVDSVLPEELKALLMKGKTL